MSEEQALPPNWRSAKDSDGKEYYFNELTGETSWDFPQADAKPPPVAAMQSPPVVTQVPIAAADSSEFAPADEPPKVQSNGAGKRTAGYGGGLSATLGEGVLVRVNLIIFCSLVVFFQSIVMHNRVPLGAKAPQAAESYGISVGVISFSFCLMYLWLAKTKPSTFSNWTLPKVKGDLSVTHCFTIFLVAWWTPATFVLTFFSPFTTTCNAYFCTWAAVIVSYLLLARAFARVQIAMRSMSNIQQDTNLKPIAGLALSSAVVLFGSIEYLDGPLPGEATYALIIGIISLVAASAMYYLVDRKKVGPGPKKAFAGLFFLLWPITASVLTFDGPFFYSGNGFFGSWVAAFCSASIAYQEFIGGQLPTGVVASSFSFTPIDDESAVAGPVSTPSGANVA